MNLAALTYEAARPLAGTSFTIERADGTVVPLTLEDVLPCESRRRRRTRRAAVPAREPFSLYFLGPPDPVLPQAIYTLRGDGATFEQLFIVPVGRDSEGTEYQAVFT